MTDKYTWEEQKKIVKDYFKLIRKKTMTATDKPNKLVQATNIFNGWTPKIVIEKKTEDKMVEYIKNNSARSLKELIKKFYKK